MSDIKPGDLLVSCGKGLIGNIIQLGSLSLPNIGPLGRWGWAGASHVMVVAPVFGELLVYESTACPRPACVRTGRHEPRGVQAHRLSDVLKTSNANIFHYPLRRVLYPHEEDRLLEALESCLGRGYDFIGAGKSGGGLLMRVFQRLKGSEDLRELFCSELVVWAWVQTGLITHRNSGAWSPQRLVRYVRRSGLCYPGRLITADSFGGLSVAT
jgi:hypothetical protein